MSVRRDRRRGSFARRTLPLRGRPLAAGASAQPQGTDANGTDRRPQQARRNRASQDALWQVERAGKLEGPLLRQNSDWLRETSYVLQLNRCLQKSGLSPITLEPASHFGKHTTHCRRQQLRSSNVPSAAQTSTLPRR